MSKRFGNLLLKTSALAVLAAPECAGRSPTDPIATFGVLGAYNKFKLEGGSESDTDRMGEGGLFFNFGNKLTAESGFIYQAGVDLKYGDHNDTKLKEGQADVDLGWRAAIDARNSVDLIVGGGYNWSRYELESNGYDMKLTGRTPSPRPRWATTTSSTT